MSTWTYDPEAPTGQKWVETPSPLTANDTEAMLLAGIAPGPPPSYELEPPPRLRLDDAPDEQPRFGAGDPFATATTPADVSAELATRLATLRARLDQLEDEHRWLVESAVHVLQQMEGP